jgi:hypothetical protein
MKWAIGFSVLFWAFLWWLGGWDFPLKVLGGLVILALILFIVDRHT